MSSSLDAHVREANRMTQTHATANRVLEQATATQMRLAEQEERVYATQRRVGDFASTFPSVNALLTRSYAHRRRDRLVLAMITAVCVLFTFMYAFRLTLS